MKPTDGMGNEIKVGDVITWPILVGHTSEIDFGRVERVGDSFIYVTSLRDEWMRVKLIQMGASEADIIDSGLFKVRRLVKIKNVLILQTEWDTLLKNFDTIRRTQGWRPMDHGSLKYMLGRVMAA